MNHQACTKFKLVLMDYDMPILNGIESTLKIQKLKEQLLIDDIPIIACSAYGSKDIIDQCLEAGMKCFIRKPVTFDILK